MNRSEFNVSVAMAVYNGERYINEQIDSIIHQLGDDDELVISYNESNDSTYEIIKQYESKDSRVKCHLCDEKGVIPNFNNAIMNCNGQIILLADQDDVWNKEKITRIKEVFLNEKIILVVHNCTFIDKNGESIPGDLFKRRNARKGLLKNTIINSYQGCCMAFRKSLVNVICPIPRDVAMHDQWIGLCAEKVATATFLDESLIQYRRHGNNVSDNRVFIRKKIKYIIKLLFNLCKVKRCK